MKEIIIYLRNYGVYLFLIFIFFANISFVIESLKNFDNFVFNPTKTINGVILKKDFTDGMDGNTFAIKASYKINNSIFFLSSTISEYSFLINSKKTQSN